MFLRLFGRIDVKIIKRNTIPLFFQMIPRDCKNKGIPVLLSSHQPSTDVVMVNRVSARARRDKNYMVSVLYIIIEPLTYSDILVFN